MTRLLLGFVTLALLAACGIQGDLERPDPMWNREHAIVSECRRERMHHEKLDSRCRQSTTVQPQTAPGPVTPPQSPTAPSANGADTTTATTTTTP